MSNLVHSELEIVWFILVDMVQTIKIEEFLFCKRKQILKRIVIAFIIILSKVVVWLILLWILQENTLIKSIRHL